MDPIFSPRQVVVSLALAAVVSACNRESSAPAGPTTEQTGSESGSGSDPSKRTPPAAEPGQLALRVETARRAYNRSGDSGVVLSVTLANGTGGAAAPLNPILFQLLSADGILTRGSSCNGTPHWLADKTPCIDGTKALAGGYAQTFEVEFASEGRTPSKVILTLPGATLATESKTVGDGRTASAEVTLEACTPCGGLECTYLNLDDSNCGACGVDASSGHGNGPYSSSASSGLSCKAGKVSCSDPKATLCGQNEDLRCTSLLSSLRDCGACGVQLENAACTDGKPTCVDNQTPYKDKVSNSWKCGDFARDVENCGAYGHSCKAVGPGPELNACVGPGKCGGFFALPPTTKATPGYCADFCPSKGLVCDKEDWFGNQGNAASCDVIDVEDIAHQHCNCVEK